MRTLSDIYAVSRDEFNQRTRGFGLPSRQTAIKMFKQIIRELDDATTDYEVLGIFASEPSLHDAIIIWHDQTATVNRVMRGVLSAAIEVDLTQYWEFLQRTQGSLDQFEEANS